MAKRQPALFPDGYPEAFEADWAAYPHFERRSRKDESYREWLRRGFHRRPGVVLAWIEVFRRTKDWKRGYVPGMQVWLKHPDLAAEPPAPEPERDSFGWTRPDVPEELLEESRRKHREWLESQAKCPAPRRPTRSS